MTALWLGRARDPSGAVASAPLSHLDGRAAGHLATWHAPTGEGGWADPRLFDAGGPAAVVSLTTVSAGGRVLFDDPAVVHARRRMLAGPSPSIVTTLLEGVSFFAGAMLGVGPGESGRLLDDDPFARLGANERFAVGPGLLRAAPSPTGPALERYGPMPWPWDRFATDVRSP
jgi:hypothetical protein